jgi:hypothetical protein
MLSIPKRTVSSDATKEINAKGDVRMHSQFFRENVPGNGRLGEMGKVNESQSGSRQGKYEGDTLMGCRRPG